MNINSQCVEEPIRLMIVDDHKAFRILLSELLNEEPHIKIVALAENGMEAVKVASLHQPDVILMDIQMPVMNGFDATQKIKQASPHICIIGLSNAADSCVIKQMMECGASTLLLKGNPPEEILETIYNCLGSLH